MNKRVSLAFSLFFSTNVLRSRITGIAHYKTACVLKLLAGMNPQKPSCNVLYLLLAGQWNFLRHLSGYSLVISRPFSKIRRADQGDVYSFAFSIKGLTEISATVFLYIHWNLLNFD